MNEIKEVLWEEYRNMRLKCQAKIDKFAGHENEVVLYERGDCVSHPEIKMGVGWSDRIVSAEEAYKFAKIIEFAAEVAEAFPYNGYLIDYKRRE